MSNNQKFLGLITRCKDEFFIKEFCDYYISQGVDRIFIIDDDSNDKSIYDDINDDRIEIIYEKNIVLDDYASKLYEKIKLNFKWMIYCDVDEFITTKKNVTNTIKDELCTTFKDVDCVKIPWVMMSCNSLEKNPKSVLNQITHRWDHDKKHPHPAGKFRCRYDQIEVKCIFKPDKFPIIFDHHPIPPGHQKWQWKSQSLDQIGIIVVDGVNNNKQKLDPLYDNLRERDIKNGYLLCYHYRIISKEHSINKLKNNLWYNKKQFSFNEMMSCDYPEIVDETLKNKTNR